MKEYRVTIDEYHARDNEWHTYLNSSAIMAANADEAIARGLSEINCFKSRADFPEGRVKFHPSPQPGLIPSYRVEEWASVHDKDADDGAVYTAFKITVLETIN